MERKKRGPYRQYLSHDSSSAVPKRTLNYWKSKKRLREKESTSESFSDSDSSRSFGDESEHQVSDDVIHTCPNLLIRASNSDDVGEIGIPSTSCNFVPETNCTTNDSQMYDSNEEYPECETASSTDQEQSDESDDEIDHSLQSNINPDLLDDGQETLSHNTRQHLNDTSYPKNVLIRTLLILAIKIRKNLDNDSLKYMTGLVDSLTDIPSRFTSLFHFKRIINSYSFPFEVHHLCPSCGLYIGVKSMVDDESVIKCDRCDIDVLLEKNKSSGNFFLYLPLTRQLEEFCTRRHTNLLYAVDRKKTCHYAIEDIMDGELYDRNLLNEESLSLNFSVDGTPLFKSSQTSITPVLCTINELHPQVRKQHIMLSSIFLGQKKPEMNEYLKPFVAEAKKLAAQGLSYSFSGTMYTKKVKILVGVCDSVERPNLRCSKAFRGAYGCGLCKHPGEEIRKGAGNVRVYPIDEDGNAFGEGLRSHSETLIHAEKSEKGIKGRSILFGIPDFDIIKNLAVDWMHCVALGVCRQFLKLWFDSQYHDKPYYLGSVINHIDCFLISIKPSLDVSRTPRKISDRLHLKAHELVIWLLFYSLPSLQPYLPHQYLIHWSRLVEAISIFLNTSILKTEVYYAQQCIFNFVKDIETLYGREHISFNVHLLTHLPESVLNWGPLWTHSAFCYENFHQLLKKLVKSSNSAELQILESLRSIFAFDKLKALIEYDLTPRQNIFLENVMNKTKNLNYSMKIKNIKMIGKKITANKLPDDHSLALRRLNVQMDHDTDVLYYKRIVINNELIHSKSYKTVKKRNSYTVLLSDKEVFEISIFMVIELQNAKVCFGLGRYFEKCRNTFFPNAKLQHLIFTKIQDTLQPLAVINVEMIRQKVTIVTDPIHKLRIACIHPNKFELLT